MKISFKHIKNFLSDDIDINTISDSLLGWVMKMRLKTI